VGTFPNALYYAQALHDNPLKGLDIISVDPNDSMFGYALDSATKVGLVSSSNSNKNKVSLRSVHGFAEALPFEDNSIDAIVATLTLCSVSDQQQALSEINRVLKSGGQYLFWEHVLSEDDTSLALQQQILTPLQTLVADGCHLNRRTGMNISNNNNGLFRGGVDIDYILLDASIIGPTAFGIATA
jgi:SAM-dependent methyltransferase